MEKARYNTELYSNLSEPLNNVKPSNFWGSHHFWVSLVFVKCLSDQRKREFSQTADLSVYAKFCFTEV